MELRNGDFGVVSSDELDSQLGEPNKVCRLKVTITDKNLGTVGDVIRASGM